MDAKERVSSNEFINLSSVPVRFHLFIFFSILFFSLFERKKKCVFQSDHPLFDATFSSWMIYFENKKNKTIRKLVKPSTKRKKKLSL